MHETGHCVLLIQIRLRPIGPKLEEFSMALTYLLQSSWSSCPARPIALIIGSCVSIVSQHAALDAQIPQIALLP